MGFVLGSAPSVSSFNEGKSCRGNFTTAAFSSFSAEAIGLRSEVAAVGSIFLLDAGGGLKSWRTLEINDASGFVGLFFWSSVTVIESPEIVVVVVVSAIAKFLEVFDFGEMALVTITLLFIYMKREITRTNGERVWARILLLVARWTYRRCDPEHIFESRVSRLLSV